MRVFTINLIDDEQEYSDYRCLSLDVKPGESFGLQFYGKLPNGGSTVYTLSSAGTIQMGSELLSDFQYGTVFLITAPLYNSTQNLPLTFTHLGRSVTKVVVPGLPPMSVWTEFFPKLTINLCVRADGYYEFKDKTIAAHSSIKIGNTTLNETQLQSLLALLETPESESESTPEE